MSSLVNEIIQGRKTFFIAPDKSLFPESYLEDYLALGYECYFVDTDIFLSITAKVEIILSVFQDALIFFSIDSPLQNDSWPNFISRLQKNILVHCLAFCMQKSSLIMKKKNLNDFILWISESSVVAFSLNIRKKIILVCLNVCCLQIRQWAGEKT